MICSKIKINYLQRTVLCVNEIFPKLQLNLKVLILTQTTFAYIQFLMRTAHYFYRDEMECTKENY